jgi:exosortase/archaeosortase
LSATSINVTAIPVGVTRLVSPSLILRLLLAALAVLICYQFHWEWLRALTCDWNIRLDALMGVNLQKIAYDTVVYRGVTYHYAVACTMADAFCGALPLIWNTRHSVVRNLGLIAAFAAILFVFNVSRLSFSDVLFAKGLSWDWAHNVVSGVCYFILWEWILSLKTFEVSRQSAPNAQL